MPEGKKQSDTLSQEERAAVKDRARELKEQKTKADGVAALDAVIKALPADDRAIASKIHEIVMDVAPDLAPKTYYGMPAWARDGKVLCFVQPSSKFGVRYSTFGFEQPAQLDDGKLWATAFAVLSIGDAEEKRIRALVKTATS
ncbi:MAG: hypothetical protein ABIQ01_04095 [Pseudolysinimonas sp.]